jgi:hypothetical protein
MEGLVKVATEKKNSTKVFNYLKQNYPEDCLMWSKEVDWSLKDIPLKDIKMARRPGGAREMDKVKGIAQAVKDGKPMEPVVLVKLPDGTIKIADGYHRTLGFDHAEKEKIKAWIANVQEDKGPWDKEMHEKKLNVGKKAAEMDLGLAKLAELEQEEKNKLGLAGAGAGAYAIHKAVPKIDGMERMYHGTNKEGGKGIRESGLQASRAGEGTATQNANLAARIGEEPLKNKVYIARDKNVARNVGIQQAGMNPFDLDVVKMKIPYQHFKDGTVPTTDNPELRGMNADEWVETIKKEMGFMAPPDAALHNAYRQLSAPITETVVGDIGTEYIKGSDNFQGQNWSGLVDYIQNNPKRFAGGVGLGALGLAGVGAGLSQVDFSQKKTANELGLAGIEKQASLLGLLGGAAALHVAPNLGMKVVKNTKTGQKGLAGTFSAGVELGRTKQKMHPNIKSVMEYGLGPESIVDYNLGKKLGSKISDMPLERQERFLSKANGMFNAHIGKLGPNAAEEINKVPILNSVKHYFDGHGENKVKDMLVRTGVPEEQKLTWKNHAGNLGMLGGAAAINPELLLQPALSGVRKKLAKSELGAKVFEKNFQAGHEGKPLSKLKETAIDMAISPAVLDSYRIGKSMNKNLPQDVNQAFKENVNVKETYQKLLAPKV